MIQYTNKLPSKVDYYELIRTEYEDIDISELGAELDSTIACACVYNGERLIGMGRVKQEENYLCIEDLIVKLEEYREEIQNNIIVNLFEQINQIKNYDINVRDCLSMKKSNEEILFKEQDNTNQISMNMSNQLQVNTYVGV